MSNNENQTASNKSKDNKEKTLTPLQLELATFNTVESIAESTFEDIFEIKGYSADFKDYFFGSMELRGSSGEDERVLIKLPQFTMMVMNSFRVTITAEIEPTKEFPQGFRKLSNTERLSLAVNSLCEGFRLPKRNASAKVALDENVDKSAIIADIMQNLTTVGSNVIPSSIVQGDEKTKQLVKFRYSSTPNVLRSLEIVQKDAESPLPKTMQGELNKMLKPAEGSK